MTDTATTVRMPSTALMQFTKASEGFSAKSYMDEGGYSIGYGHHTAGITAGMVWTQAQADSAFEWDMTLAATDVVNRVLVPLSQGQFDCLCDFRYNVGAGRFEGSMLLSALNQGNYARVPLELYRVDPVTGEQHGWIFAEGQVNEGLVGRRKGEIGFWNRA